MNFEESRGLNTTYLKTSAYFENSLLTSLFAPVTRNQINEWNVTSFTERTQKCIWRAPCIRVQSKCARVYFMSIQGVRNIWNQKEITPFFTEWAYNEHDHNELSDMFTNTLLCLLMFVHSVCASLDCGWYNMYLDTLPTTHYLKDT